jgi:serine/threonine protein phosphatase PrpC
VTLRAMPYQDPGVVPDGGSADLDLTLAVGMATDVGSVRELNEDSVHYLVPVDEAARRSKGAIFLVADGMGGHQAGEVASRWAAEQVTYEYYADADNDPGNSLVRALKAANQTLYDQAQADPAKLGMGTTMVAAVVLGRSVYVVNVGDSRAYFINKREIGQITEDHSWVEEQVQAGLMTREQAERHPQRNLITRALGSKPAVEVDLFKGTIQEGDILLLCSDGLSGSLSEQQMAAIARAELPPQAALRLIALAKEQKAEDNISVLIVRAAAAQGQQAGRPRVAKAKAMGDEIPTEAVPADRVSAKHPEVEHRGRPFSPAAVKAWLQDLAERLPWSDGQRQKVFAVLVPVVLVCCLCAVVTGFWAMSHFLVGKPTKAPRLAGIHYENLTNIDLDQLAISLGYTDTMEMFAANQIQFDPARPMPVDLLPAQRGVFVAGLARDWKCPEHPEHSIPFQGGTYTCTLTMADREYAVRLELQFHDQENGKLSGRQVRVFGYQDKEGAPVTAQLIELGKSQVLGRPAWDLVYDKNYKWGALEWVYSTMDHSPYSPVEMGSCPTLRRGDPILLRGTWLPGRPGEAMSFQANSIYRFGANVYVPEACQPNQTPKPTVTLIPRADQKP